MDNTDFVAADLSDTDLTGARLSNADLRHASLQGIHWRHIAAIDGANVWAVRDAPEGFISWALAHRAVSVKGDGE
jgi:uncharacterized protein YjbI with pentapeptide repeats